MSERIEITISRLKIVFVVFVLDDVVSYFWCREMNIRLAA